MGIIYHITAIMKNSSSKANPKEALQRWRHTPPYR